MYEELKMYIQNLDYKKLSMSELEKYTSIVIKLKKFEYEETEHKRLEESLNRVEDLLKGGLKNEL